MQAQLEKIQHPHLQEKIIDNQITNFITDRVDGKSLLILAAMRNCFEDIKLLCEGEGKELSKEQHHKTYKNTPLMWAIANSSVQAACELIEHGDPAQFKIGDGDRRTPLMLSILKGRGHINNEEFLDQYTTATGERIPLLPQSVIIDHLLTQGNPKEFINAKDRFGQTALSYAILHQDLETIKRLIQAGADLTDQSKWTIVENRSDISWNFRVSPSTGGSFVSKQEFIAKLLAVGIAIQSKEAQEPSNAAAASSSVVAESPIIAAKASPAEEVKTTASEASSPSPIGALEDSLKQFILSTVRDYGIGAGTWVNRFGLDLGINKTRAKEIDGAVVIGTYQIELRKEGTLAILDKNNGYAEITDPALKQRIMAQVQQTIPPSVWSVGLPSKPLSSSSAAAAAAASSASPSAAMPAEAPRAQFNSAPLIANLLDHLIIASRLTHPGAEPSLTALRKYLANHAPLIPNQEIAILALTREICNQAKAPFQIKQFFDSQKASPFSDVFFDKALFFPELGKAIEDGRGMSFGESLPKLDEQTIEKMFENPDPSFSFGQS